MYLDKRVLVNRIKNAAQIYKNKLVGKVFMIIYGNQYIEVIFKTSSFYDLTGVATTLTAENFYKKAKRRSLRPEEIFFDSLHPADFADLKTMYLDSLGLLISSDILVAKNITTATALFPIGLTDLNIVICLGKNTDRHGELLSEYLIPYSLRVESIRNDRVDFFYEVSYIFSKAASDVKYSQMEFGDETQLNSLSDEIKSRISAAQFLR